MFILNFILPLPFSNLFLTTFNMECMVFCSQLSHTLCFRLCPLLLWSVMTDIKNCLSNPVFKYIRPGTWIGCPLMQGLHCVLRGWDPWELNGRHAVALEMAVTEFGPLLRCFAGLVTRGSSLTFSLPTQTAGLSHLHAGGTLVLITNSSVGTLESMFLKVGRDDFP